MPGPEGYGPGGKWIHDRAHRIMKDGDTPKDTAYALATQQAHKVGKSPKDFRTSEGVHEAKEKYDEPKAEYQKTAMLDELSKIAKMNPAAAKEAAEQVIKRALRKKGKEKDSQGTADMGAGSGGGAAAAAPPPPAPPPPPPPPPPAGAAGGGAPGGGAGGM